MNRAAHWMRAMLGEYGVIDVRGDGGEDQALEFGRFQGLNFPLHGVGMGGAQGFHPSTEVERYVLW